MVGGVVMAYESFRILHNNTYDISKQMLNAKRKQIEFLYESACDKEDNCLLNDKPFFQSPRIFNRKIKTNYYQTVVIETINEKDRFKSGDILFYDNDYWLCTSSFVFHNLYCKGEFIRTNYTLKWQNANGDIISRRAYIISASQYNSGETTTNKTITLGYNQQMVVLPSDNETNVLNHRNRFFIDKNLESPKVYRVTRNDTVPYSDWDRGCVCLIVTEEQFNEKTDSIEQWICDYWEIDDKVLPSEIQYSGKPQIRCGGYKTFAIDYDNDITWSIECLPEQEDYIEISPLENKCKVSCKFNNLLIGSSFRLVAGFNDKQTSVLISIVGGV